MLAYSEVSPIHTRRHVHRQTPCCRSVRVCPLIRVYMHLHVYITHKICEESCTTYAKQRQDPRDSSTKSSQWLQTSQSPTRLRGPTGHINIRILPTMVSGIPIILGLGTGMQDPCVFTLLYHTILYHTSIPYCAL